MKLFVKLLTLGLLFLAARHLRAQSSKPKSIDVDLEVARVKKRLRAIQSSDIDREKKVQKQSDLIDHEVKRLEKEINEIQSAASDDKDEASRNRRKAGLDNIQKFLDILRNMKPDI